MKSGPGYKQHPEHRITTQPAGVRVHVRFKGELIADSREAIELRSRLSRGLLPAAQRREDGPARPLDPSDLLPVQRPGIVLFARERAGERALELRRALR